MKKIFLTLALFGACITFALAQETKDDKINKMIKDGAEYVKAKQYKEAAGSLQEAINIINEIIGDVILQGLPKSAGGLTSDPANDQITSLGTLMGAGMQVQRMYYNEKGQSVNITIQPNSPQLSSLNTFLDNPDDYPGEEAGKRVKVKDFKSLLRFTKAEGEESSSSGYLTMPFYTSVVTVQGGGFADEKEFLAFLELFDWQLLAKNMGYIKE